jgi:thioredoxin 1
MYIDEYKYIHLQLVKERAMSQHVKELDEAGFEDLVLQSDKPVLADFWAPWCGPCRAMSPAVDAVAQKLSQTATVVKVNVDDNPAISSRYNIRGIPTLILFKDGKEANRLVGLQSQDQIAALVTKG